MKIVFSRKGFDTQNGRGPSPIVGGRPVSLPIPDTKGISRTTYGDLGLGELAHAASRGAYGAESLCHNDPMFLDDGQCVLGQCQSAQGHLANQGVGVGDALLFFGLFREPGGKPHHRIFGYLKIAEVIPLAGADEATRDRFRAMDHPHALGMHGTNDTLYVGEGRTARTAPEALRLTVPEGPLTLWTRPPWLRRGELTYFGTSDRNWPAGRLWRTGPAQEFVADIGEREEPREWLAQIIEAICR
ncbi:hypothetical protein [Alteriqipengyuania sp.]|uniref:Nmad3 family putative nucleotide modification protein n=1 Tax=Alteriqipengyuania sp. TaxID=2800692 RepID=UPI0035198405